MVVYVLLPLAFILTLSGCAPPFVEPPRDYRVALDGRPADTEFVATVTWPPGGYAGFIEDSAFCGAAGYLMTRDQVHWIDLESGSVVGRIGRRGQGPGEWEHAAALAADCDDGVIYVVDRAKGALAFSAADGEYRGTIPRPEGFAPGGGHAGATGGELWAPGLWPRGGRPITTVRNGGGMFDGARLGWRVSPGEDVAGAPVAAPIVEGCHAISWACFTYPLDRFRTSNSSFWFVGQGGSVVAHVLDGEGALVTSVDIRSPRFERDGTRAVVGSGLVEETQWGLTNSTVQGVFGWDDTLGVVHVLHATRDWTPGRIMQFEVFLNLFSSTGDPLVADVRLPDFSIGRTGEYIYFLDYGESGRRRDVDLVDIRRLSLPRLREELLATGRSSSVD